MGTQPHYTSPNTINSNPYLIEEDDLLSLEETDITHIIIYPEAVQWNPRIEEDFFRPQCSMYH